MIGFKVGEYMDKKLEIKKVIINYLEQYGIILLLENDCDENIIEYGIDSISYISLICDLEQHFCISIPTSLLDFQEDITVNKLSQVIQNLT